MVERIISFLEQIGLQVHRGPLTTTTILPGVTVDCGALVVDLDKLLWPGDLLHEAGHLAALSPEQRAAASVNFGDDGGYEMAAIAWSWAALCELGLDPSAIFHAAGYRGGAGALIENFSAGNYIGVPMLEWLGMTAQGTRAAELGVEPYPAMIRWVL
ncbi:MAG: hypothetical protein WAK93_04335 [Solirubrobacteraceae bacterium]